MELILEKDSKAMSPALAVAMSTPALPPQCKLIMLGAHALGYTLARKMMLHAYCYPCRFFKISGLAKSDVAFTSNGFQDWKHALGERGGLQKHDQYRSHMEVVMSWNAYQTPRVEKKERSASRNGM